MSQSPAPVGAPVTNSAAGTFETPSRTYGLKSALVLAAVCMAIGYAFYIMDGRLKSHSLMVDDTRARAQKFAGDLTTLEQQTARFARSVPTAQQQLQQRLTEMEQVHQSMTDQLQSLRLQANGAQVERDQRLARLAQVHATADQIRHNIGAFKTDLAAWNSQVKVLATSDQGKHLASDPSRISLLVSILDRPTTGPDQIAAWEKQLELRLQSVPRAAKNSSDGGVIISDGLLSDLTEVADAVRLARGNLEQRRGALHGLLDELPAGPAPPDARELGAALAKHRNRAAREREERIAAATRRAADEYAARLAEERAGTQRTIGEQQLQHERMRRQLELDAVKANAEVEAKKIRDAIADIRREEAQRQAEHKARVERQILEAKFQRALPDVRRYLAAFITPGRYQLAGRKWVYCDEPVSVSWGGITSAGVFSNDQSGYQQMYRIAGGRDNDRPNGPFADYIGGAIHPNQVPVVRKAQMLLMEFGDLMVEKGMLAP